jgi:hypothetical protein
VSLGIRVLFLIFAILYTALSAWVALMTRKTMPNPGSDQKLVDATKHYRLAKYSALLPRLSICLVFWTLAASPSWSKTALILLCIPMFLSSFLILGTGLAWRGDFKLLRDAGLVRSPWGF